MAARKSTTSSQPRYRRINITIREEQYQHVLEVGTGLSGLIRDLIDDRFSSTKIVLNLSPEARRLYDLLISNFGVQDLDLEPYFLEALDDIVKNRSKELSGFREDLLRRKTKVSKAK